MVKRLNWLKSEQIKMLHWKGKLKLRRFLFSFLFMGLFFRCYRRSQFGKCTKGWDQRSEQFHLMISEFIQFDWSHTFFGVAESHSPFFSSFMPLFFCCCYFILLFCDAITQFCRQFNCILVCYQHFAFLSIFILIVVRSIEMNELMIIFIFVSPAIGIFSVFARWQRNSMLPAKQSKAKRESCHFRHKSKK